MHLLEMKQMEKRELQRKIIATSVITTIFCALLGVSVYLLLTSELFTTTIQWLMIACCGILAISVIGFVWNKILEIRALKIVMRDNVSLQNTNTFAASENAQVNNTSIQNIDNYTFTQENLFVNNSDKSENISQQDDSVFETQDSFDAIQFQFDETVDNANNVNTENFIDKQVSYSEFQKVDENDAVVNSPVANYDESKLLQNSVKHNHLINNSINNVQNADNNNVFSSQISNETQFSPNGNNDEWQLQNNFTTSSMQSEKNNLPAQSKTYSAPVAQSPIPPVNNTQANANSAPIPSAAMQNNVNLIQAPANNATMPPPAAVNAHNNNLTGVQAQQSAQKPLNTAPSKKPAPSPIDWAEIKRTNENKEKDRLHKIALEKARANEAAFKLAAEREKHAIEMALKEKEKRDLMQKQQQQIIAEQKRSDQTKLSQEQYEKMREEEMKKAQLRKMQEQERLAKEQAMRQAAAQQANIAIDRAKSAQEAAKRSDEIAKRLSVLAGLSED